MLWFINTVKHFLWRLLYFGDIGALKNKPISDFNTLTYAQVNRDTDKKENLGRL